MLDDMVVGEVLDQGGFVRPHETLQLTLDGWLQGWAVVRYQMAFAGASRDSWLVIDGLAGPKTQAAMEDYGTRLAPSFDAREFVCRHCGLSGVRRELIAGLQQLRNRTGKPVRIVSGWRCVEHNAAVGGARESMHLEGLAADITPAPPQRLVRGLRAFSGMGFVGRGSTVRHVDARHVLKGQKASPADPATWRY